MNRMQPTSTASGIAWDLADLYAGLDDPRIERDLASARRRAEAFEQTCRGKIAALTAADAELLARTLAEFEALSEQMDKPLVYAMLVHSAQTEEPRHGALLARTREQRTQINKHLIFFDLEWLQVGDAAAAALIDHPRLARYRHWLAQKRAWKPHYLSELEEKI